MLGDWAGKHIAFSPFFRAPIWRLSLPSSSFLPHFCLTAPTYITLNRSSRNKCMRSCLSICGLLVKVCFSPIYRKSDILEKMDSFVTAASGDHVLSSDEPETTLGGRICNARQEAGLTLRSASRLADVKASNLRDSERGRSEPRVNKLVALAPTFGVSPTKIFG